MDAWNIYRRTLILLGLLSLSAAYASAALNATHNSDYNQLVNGKPFQGVRDMWTDTLGTLAYAIFAGGLFVGLWLRTNMLFSVLILDLVEGGILWTYMPSEVQLFIYILNFVAIGTIIYRLVSPIHGE